MDSWRLLLEIIALLGASLIFGGVASRLGQSPLVGYLLAGMILGGPGSLRIVQSEADIQAVAELGVSLLLFSLGLEFSWETLKQLGRKTLFAGVLQILSTVLLLFSVALVFGLQVTEAIGIGVMLCLSSTAAVIRILTDLSEVDSPHTGTLHQSF